MRTVVDNSMVAHLWANQAQDHAHSGNMSFRGPSIFSYAAEIGRFVTRKGKRCALLADRTWSITTTGHQWRVRHAIDRETVPIFRVIDLGPRYGEPNDHTHETNWKHFLGRLEGLAAKMKRSRKYADSYATNILRLAEEANAYSKFFGLRKRLPTDPDGIGALIKRCQDDRERIEAAERKRQQEAQRVAAARLAEAIEAWKAGDRHAYCSSAPKTYLRVIGDELQTSRGATVPLDHAKKAFAFIAQCREHGRHWERNGHTVRVGHFQIDSIEPNGDIKAGCHRIEWDEIERIARTLDLV